MPAPPRVRALAGVALVALVAAGCSDSDDSSNSDEPSPDPTTSEESTSSTTATDAPDGLRAYYRQDVDWSSCSAGECATVKVPVDYKQPDGDTTELALARHRAEGSDDKLGTLFINPGGPGGSGVDYLETFVSEASDEMLARYDIVGFDPRGVADSDPVDCVSDERLDKILASDPDPDTKAEVDAAISSIKKMGKGCLANSGELAAHVSTIEVAKDLDVLRGLVGDEKLRYVGASYGTFIGSTYAELFPKRVSRMVLDGAIDPSLGPRESGIAQAKGFQEALRSYAQNCVDTVSSCPLGDDVDAGLKKVGDFLDRLDDKPLDSGDPDRPLTRSLAFYGIALPLYNQQSWPALTKGLTAAFEGNGALLLSFSDQYFSRTSAGYETNQQEAMSAISCLDGRSDATAAEIRKAESRYLEAAPTFGEFLAWSELQCSKWPIKQSYKPLKIDGKGAAPILVVGTTRDPATPYEQAVALSKQLASGVLLTREGDGHTAYHRGNPCIDKAIDGYLLEGNVPDDGTRC